MSTLYKKIEDSIKERQESKNKPYNPSEWIDTAVKKAPQLNLGTHMIKYTHSSAKGACGLLVGQDNSHNDAQDYFYLSTSCIKNRKLDFSGNAAVFDVAGFLLIEDDGKTLIEMIHEGDFSALSPFAKNHEQLQEWVKGFQSLFITPSPETHTLAKQVYFPIEKGEYHLLGPVFSSSLQQIIYDRIQESRYAEKYKEARRLKRENIFSETTIVSFPNLLCQYFGGTKPQNISYQNSSYRKGKSFLLSCQPPTWNTDKGVNLKNKYSFWNHFSWVAKEQIHRMKNFLLAVSNSESNFNIRKKRSEYICDIVDQFIQTIAVIRRQSGGWSSDSSIPLHEKYCLDLNNTDLDFQSKRKDDPWREKMSDAFSIWLKRKLKHAKIDLGDSEFENFKGECLDALKELE